MQVLKRDMSRHKPHHHTGSRLRLVHFKTTYLDEIVIVFCLLTDDEQKV